MYCVTKRALMELEYLFLVGPNTRFCGHKYVCVALPLVFVRLQFWEALPVVE